MFQSEFRDEIEMLVAQTFRDAEMLSKDGNDLVFSDEEQSDFHDSGNMRLPDEVPGILYYLQKKASTFVIRIHPTNNLSETRKSILANPEDYPSLRLLSGDDDRSLEEKLDFHECDNLQLAQAIKHQLANKRFPLHEERIINVSDPGDNWWVKADGERLAIYFKLCRTESMDSLIKAGPLGERDGAMDFFNKLYGYFSLIFPVKDFSSAHGQFFLSCEHEAHPLFQELVKVFTEGEIGNGLWEKLRDLEFGAKSPEVLSSIKRANYFLMEVAAMRSFWVEIQKKLS